jgi:hypothetical protein
MKSSQASLPAIATGLLALAICGSAFAAEGLRVRYPISGTAGGELSAPGVRSGWLGSIGATHFSSDKVTDNDGNPVVQTVPVVVGTFSTTTPGAVSFSQTQDTVNFVLGYLSENEYAGGHVTFALNLPLHRIRRTVRIAAVTPTLPVPLQSKAAQVDAALQAQLATQGASLSGEVSGFGDAELSAGWSYHQDRLRVLAGATLVMPTGAYESGRSVNPGLGDYYTLRPSAGFLYEVQPGTMLTGRATIGLNGSNSATKYRSGNFTAFEASAIQRFSSFVLGLNVFNIRQYEDDTGPGVPATGLRLKASGAGPFMTTYLEQYKTAITLAYSQNFNTVNGTPGKFFRARASIDF